MIIERTRIHSNIIVICSGEFEEQKTKVMKVHGGKDFAKLQKAFIILSQTFWLTLLYRRVDVSVARCGFHEIGKKTLDSSYSEILRTIDVLQKEIQFW